MNKFKTFSYYLGTIVIANICVTLLVFTSNKIFDNLPDVLFVPTKAAALGYIPFILAASVALITSNNYEWTQKILWKWKLIIASLFCLFGLIQLIVSIYLSVPLFEFNEEVSILTQPNHWLHSLPVGLSGLVAVIQVKKDKIDIF